MRAIPGDPHSLAMSIEKLAEMSPAERQRMGERGRSYVEQNHDFRVLGSRLADIFQELVPAVEARSSQPSGGLNHLSQDGNTPMKTMAPMPQLQPPIIIIGAPRSGTNMLRDVLTSLPGMGTWPCDEINYTWRYQNPLWPTDELTPQQATSEVRWYVRRQFEKLATHGRFKCVVEKTCANSLRVDFVRKVVPEARFVFLVRDGRDAIASAQRCWQQAPELSYLLRKARFVPAGDVGIVRQALPASTVAPIVLSPTLLEELGPAVRGEWTRCEAARVCWKSVRAQWARCVQRASESLAEIPSDQRHQLRYEDFVRQPANALRGILDQFQFDFDGNQIAHAVRSVNGSSIGKWSKSIRPGQLRANRRGDRASLATIRLPRG